MSARAYPLPRPAEDPRFNVGLLSDVAKVIEEHGYPPVAAGRNILDLQSALFGFLYQGGQP